MDPNYESRPMDQEVKNGTGTWSEDYAARLSLFYSYMIFCNINIILLKYKI